MSRFTLNKISDTVYSIKLGRDKIGHVTQYGSRYTAIAHNKHKRIEKSCDTANAAFSELVKSYNRINMCGEDSLEKARLELDKRNEQALAKILHSGTMLSLRLHFHAQHARSAALSGRTRKVYILTPQAP